MLYFWLLNDVYLNSFYGRSWGHTTGNLNIEDKTNTNFILTTGNVLSNWVNTEKQHKEQSCHKAVIKPLPPKDYPPKISKSPAPKQKLTVIRNTLIFAAVGAEEESQLYLDERDGDNGDCELYGEQEVSKVSQSEAGELWHSAGSICHLSTLRLKIWSHIVHSTDVREEKKGHGGICSFELLP